MSEFISEGLRSCFYLVHVVSLSLIFSSDITMSLHGLYILAFWNRVSFVLREWFEFYPIYFIVVSVFEYLRVMFRAKVMNIGN